MPPPFRPMFPGLPRPPITIPLAPPVPPVAMPRVRSITELVDELRGLRAQMNRSVHRCGVILAELSQPARITEAGVVDFEGLLARYDLGAPVSAMKYIAVAQSFSEDEAAQLGIERGYAIVRAAHALPSPIAPRTLLAQNPTITVPSGTHRLALAPLRVVLEWAGSLRVTPSAAPTKGMYKDADSVRDKLHRRFAAAGIAQARMRVVRRRDGYVVRVELAPEDAAALLRLVKPTR